jgi:MFS family permease
MVDRPDQVAARAPAGTRFRWVIVAILCTIAFVLYIDRVNLMVAIPSIEGEFDLDEQTCGNILSAFLFGYAVGLVPGGWLADRFGAHRILTAAGLSWGLLTILAGCLRKSFHETSLDPATTLIALRFLLGVCEACAFPAFSRALANWMRRSERAMASGLIHCGSGLGGSFTPIFIAAIISQWGWRTSFILSGLITFGVALLWWRAAADEPAEHKRVSLEELRIIAADKEECHAKPPDWAWYRRAACSLSAYMLCVSEVFLGLTGFVFVTWFYKYFVQVRQAGAMSSAVFSSLNYLAIAVGAPIGGYLCDRCVRRWGSPWGRRIVPLVSITLSGLCSIVAPTVANNAVSAGLFALACGLLYAAAAAFWSTLIDVTRRGAGVLGGLMNGSGSLGGAIGTICFPWLLGQVGWTLALQFGGLMGIFSGLSWMLIDSSRQIDSPRPTSAGTGAAADHRP